MDVVEKRAALETVNFWINSVDTKASILLASYGVIISVLLSQPIIDHIIKITKSLFQIRSFSTSIISVFVVFVPVLFFTGIALLVKSLTPRIIKKNGGSVSIQSISFFAAVSQHKTFDSYLQKVYECQNDTEFYENDLLTQIYFASRICTRKHVDLRRGIILSATAVFFFIVLLAFGYFIAL